MFKVGDWVKLLSNEYTGLKLNHIILSGTIGIIKEIIPYGYIQRKYLVKFIGHGGLHKIYPNTIVLYTPNFKEICMEMLDDV